MAAPAVSRQISIQVYTRDNGPGSISVDSNGEEYSKEWEQLTPDVSAEINEQLDAMNLGGQFSEGKFQVLKIQVFMNKICAFKSLKLLTTLH